MERRIVLKKSEIGRGWIFLIYFDDRKYANVISVRYRTKKRASEYANTFIQTGKLEWFDDKF
jgi:hypothetical protein